MVSVLAGVAACHEGNGKSNLLAAPDQTDRWRHYVLTLSVCSSVCLSVRLIVRSSVTKLVNTMFWKPPNWFWRTLAQVVLESSSSSRMCVMNHNWSATKQRLHPPSVAEISCHSVLSGNSIRQCEWDIIWVSPQWHRSVSVSRCFFLQAPQWPCSLRKRFSKDHCCRGRSKPGCRIVGSHTRWELTTWADFQLCLHRLSLSTGCKSSHNGFLDVSRSNGGLRLSGWIGQLSWLPIFSTNLSVAAFLRRAGGSMSKVNEMKRSTVEVRRSKTEVTQDQRQIWKPSRAVILDRMGWVTFLHHVSK